MSVFAKGTTLGEARAAHGPNIVPPQVPDWATYLEPPAHFDAKLHRQETHGPWVFFKERPIHETADTSSKKNLKVNEVFKCPVIDCEEYGELFEVQVVQLQTTKAQQIQCKACKFSFYVTEARAF